MSHEQISCGLPEEKQKCLHIHSSIKRKKVEKKKKKNEAAELYLDPCQISLMFMMECFCENTKAKSFIIEMFDMIVGTPLGLCKILKSI